MSRTYKQTPTRIAFRFLAGRPLDGYPRTDSTFFRRGTVPVLTNPTGRMSHWSTLAGWQRSAWRVGVPLVLVSVPVGWLLHPWITAAVVVVGLLALAGWAARRIFRAFRNWRHRRTYVLPFHRTLARELGVIHATPERWLDVPVNFQDDEADPVRVRLPDNTRISPELKEAIRQVVAQKLGLHDPNEVYSTVGPAPVASFRPAPRPPARVGWKDVAEAFRNAPEHAPVLGLGPRNAIVVADLEADSPHIAVSAGSGGGKSVLIRNIIVHALHHGAGCVILDYKRASQRPLEGLPGVVIAKNIEDIHDWAVKLGAECERRNRAADEPGGVVGHRIIVAIEEWNALSAKLSTYWEQIREKGQPKKSPAVQALSDITFMGRHVLMNAIGVAQLLSARTTGGPETRENFATRCMTRYTVNAWKMLAPEVWPMPKKSKVVGRWQIVKGGEAYETQVAFLTEDEARGWAISGVDNPSDVLVSQGPSVAPSLGVQPGTVPAEPVPAVAGIGLREAVESGKLPGPVVTLDAIRAWRKRDSNFPAPVGKNGQEDLFDLADLVSYKRRRDAISIVRGDVA